METTAATTTTTTITPDDNDDNNDGSEDEDLHVAPVDIQLNVTYITLYVQTPTIMQCYTYACTYAHKNTHTHTKN